MIPLQDIFFFFFYRIRINSLLTLHAFSSISYVERFLYIKHTLVQNYRPDEYIYSRNYIESENYFQSFLLDNVSLLPYEKTKVLEKFSYSRIII